MAEKNPSEEDQADGRGHRQSRRTSAMKDELKKFTAGSQKTTFTRWINVQLLRAGVKDVSVDDLFQDLRDGVVLQELVCALSPGAKFRRERGKKKVHCISNLNAVLVYLRGEAKMKLVNIDAEDMYAGKENLTLGLIWGLVQHYQMAAGHASGKTASEFRKGVLAWCQECVRDYDGVRVADFTKSWKNGLAFNALLHHHKPDVIDFASLVAENAVENLENAFAAAETHFGVPRLLDAEGVNVKSPDEKSIMTYVLMLKDAVADIVPAAGDAATAEAKEEDAGAAVAAAAAPVEVSAQPQQAQKEDRSAAQRQELLQWIADERAAIGQRDSKVPKGDRAALNQCVTVLDEEEPAVAQKRADVEGSASGDVAAAYAELEKDRNDYRGHLETAQNDIIQALLRWIEEQRAVIQERKGSIPHEDAAALRDCEAVLDSEKADLEANGSSVEASQSRAAASAYSALVNDVLYYRVDLEVALNGISAVLLQWIADHQEVINQRETSLFMGNVHEPRSCITVLDNEKPELDEKGTAVAARDVQHVSSVYSDLVKAIAAYREHLEDAQSDVSASLSQWIGTQREATRQRTAAIPTGDSAALNKCLSDLDQEQPQLDSKRVAVEECDAQDVSAAYADLVMEVAAYRQSLEAARVALEASGREAAMQWIAEQRKVISQRDTAIPAGDTSALDGCLTVLDGEKPELDGKAAVVGTCNSEEVSLAYKKLVEEVATYRQNVEAAHNAIADSLLQWLSEQRVLVGQREAAIPNGDNAALDGCVAVLDGEKPDLESKSAGVAACNSEEVSLAYKKLVEEVATYRQNVEAARNAIADSILQWLSEQRALVGQREAAIPNGNNAALDGCVAVLNGEKPHLESKSAGVAACKSEAVDATYADLRKEVDAYRQHLDAARQDVSASVLQWIAQQRDVTRQREVDMPKGDPLALDECINVLEREEPEMESRGIEAQMINSAAVASAYGDMVKERATYRQNLLAAQAKIHALLSTINTATADAQEVLQWSDGKCAQYGQVESLASCQWAQLTQRKAEFGAYKSTTKPTWDARKKRVDDNFAGFQASMLGAARRCKSPEADAFEQAKAKLDSSWQDLTEKEEAYEKALTRTMEAMKAAAMKQIEDGIQAFRVEINKFEEPFNRELPQTSSELDVLMNHFKAGSSPLADLEKQHGALDSQISLVGDANLVEAERAALYRHKINELWTNVRGHRDEHWLRLNKANALARERENEEAKRAAAEASATAAASAASAAPMAVSHDVIEAEQAVDEDHSDELSGRHSPDDQPAEENPSGESTPLLGPSPPGSPRRKSPAGLMGDVEDQDEAKKKCCSCCTIL